MDRPKTLSNDIDLHPSNTTDNFGESNMTNLSNYENYSKLPSRASHFHGIYDDH